MLYIVAGVDGDVKLTLHDKMRTMDSTAPHSRRIAIIGGGPAGLTAAGVLAAAGVAVHVFDAMPSVGRKFLLAGKGGMNITHSEPYDQFIARYGACSAALSPWLDRCTPQDVREWIHSLGIDTFIGTSGRVFPSDMKAAPLLRAWLHGLREQGVQFHMRHRWQGWRDGALVFATADGEKIEQFDACVLALGGASWARLGSDGAWVALLEEKAIAVAPLAPSNCGFDVAWSAHFAGRYAGHPLTTVAISAHDRHGQMVRRQGQFVVTRDGVEGSLIYALSANLRDQIGADGSATIWLDLCPDYSAGRVHDEVCRPRGARSMSSHLQSRLGIKGVKSGLLRECLSAAEFADEASLAAAIKMLPLRLQRPRPIDEAISSAGGVPFEALAAAPFDGMLARLPGVFVAGEMLDWEAPTGGYLLTACFASGRAAARGALAWLAR